MTDESAARVVGTAAHGMVGHGGASLQRLGNGPEGVVHPGLGEGQAPRVQGGREARPGPEPGRRRGRAGRGAREAQPAAARPVAAPVAAAAGGGGSRRVSARGAQTWFENPASVPTRSERSNLFQP